MERNTETKKKTLSAYRRSIGYDEDLIKQIATHCGSKAVKSSVPYLRLINFHNAKLYCEVYENVCFFAITFSKTSVRIIEIAVVEEKQGEGLGAEMLKKIKRIAKKEHKKEITLRTSMKEKAIEFYQKQGGRIVGINNGDYEVVIPILK